MSLEKFLDGSRYFRDETVAITISVNLKIPQIMTILSNYISVPKELYIVLGKKECREWSGRSLEEREPKG